jgi:hypothetical protein
MRLLDVAMTKAAVWRIDFSREVAMVGKTA